MQTFLLHALIGGILASIACGVIGPFVVVKRISYIAGGITHTVFAGMGIAYFLGTNPLYGALITALIAAIIIGLVSIHAIRYQDTIISALWAIGTAIGVLFISKTPGYNTDLTSFLFGNILMVSKQQLYLMFAMDIIVLLTIFLCYKYFVAVCFDEEFTWLRGINVKFYYLLLLCLIAITAVLLIQLVGLILVIALLTLPAAIAYEYVSSIPKMCLISTILGCVFSTVGFGTAYMTNTPVSPNIIILAALAFLIAMALRSIYHKFVVKHE